MQLSNRKKNNNSKLFFFWQKLFWSIFKFFVAQLIWKTWNVYTVWLYEMAQKNFYQGYVTDWRTDAHKRREEQYMSIARGEISRFHTTGCPVARGNHIFQSGRHKLIPDFPTGQPKALLCVFTFTNWCCRATQCHVGQPVSNWGCPTRQFFFVAWRMLNPWSFNSNTVPPSHD